METSFSKRRRAPGIPSSADEAYFRRRSSYRHHISVAKEKQRSYEDYWVAIICALDFEMSAVRYMLDTQHAALPTKSGDTNLYVLGTLSGHNVVIACLPGTQGKGAAAHVANNLERTFPCIQWRFLVGIGGGVPSDKHDIRLGDVVVSMPEGQYSGVVQYDLGKDTEVGFVLKGSLFPSPTTLINAVGLMRSDHLAEANKIPDFISDMLTRKPKLALLYRRPSADSDILFQPDSQHVPNQDACSQCDQSRVVRQLRRSSDAPELHYGLIASGDRVMRSAIKRNSTSKDLGDILCFEMEAGGIATQLPCLVIRGISDYADSHKNNKWQHYAAATAAGCTKELLRYLDVPDVPPAILQGENWGENLTPENEEDSMRNESITKGRMTNKTGLKLHQMDEANNFTEEHKRSLLKSLEFAQFNARQANIRPVHMKTCSWLLSRHEYLDWLDASKLENHHGFLWIKGKPGTGKSTIMKYAHLHAERTMKDKIVISFFFNARGVDLEKSTNGMYRSLLLQLLLRRPDLQTELLNSSDTLESIKLHGEHQEFTTETLKQMFKEAVNHLSDSTMVCFVDALDECKERQIRDMLSFFQQVNEDAIAGNIQFRVCLSSRHYPHINIDRGLSLILEDQEEHGQDIVKYISSELKIGRSKVAEDIRGRLRGKASGIFMWVVLVVGILNKAYDRGRTPQELRRKLQDIPDDLNELFRDIIERKGDDDNKDALILCIQWILFARQPLSPKQLYFAVQSGIAPDSVSASFASDEIPRDTIERFLLDCSKGLAEITWTWSLTVQFIHESVVDFLLKDNGFAEILGNVGGNFRGVSHERLKQYCVSYIDSDLSAYLLASNETLPGVSFRGADNNVSPTSQAFSFLKYAVENVLYHADAAMESGITQEDFLTSFQLSRWVKLQNVFETYHYKHNVSLLYVLTERGMSSLITTCTSVLSTYLYVEEERYGTPLFAALVTGNTRVVQAFLKAHAASRPSEKEEYLRSLCVQYAQDESNRPLLWGLGFRYSSIKGVLGHLAELGNEILFEFALDIYAYKLLELHGISTGTPLSYAARNGHDLIVRSLIGRYRANVNSQVPIGRTPLSWAAQNGHDNVVRVLLNTYNINVNLQDTEGRTPLAWAASNGHNAIVKSLLERRDVNINLPDRSGCTPCFVVAKYGHSTTVKLLLERNDFNVNLQDEDGWTPLAWAASNGHDAIVKSLLERRDVNINLPDRLGRTPLLLAARFGRSMTVRLLLERNDVHVNQRDMYLWTPLAMAAKHGNDTIVKSLLSRHDIHVNLRGQHRCTALYWGVREGHENVVKLLLDRHDIDATLRDSTNGTLLSCAVESRHGAIVKLLLDRLDIDVNSEDLEGLTPFTLACTERLDDIAKLILDTGKVDPDIVQKYSRFS